jgi:hypothetical protein
MDMPRAFTDYREFMSKLLLFKSWNLISFRGLSTAMSVASGYTNLIVERWLLLSQTFIFVHSQSLTTHPELTCSHILADCCRWKMREHPSSTLRIELLLFCVINTPHVRCRQPTKINGVEYYLLLLLTVLGPSDWLYGELFLLPSLKLVRVPKCVAGIVT